MNTDILNFLTDHLSALEFKYEPITKGGSDRNFFRIRLPDSQSFIFMCYGTEVEENAYWVEINRFLNDLGIPVPRLIACDARRRFLLIEDLGDTDLFAQRTEPWHRRRPYYLMALSEIHRLHRHDPAALPATLKLCNGYDRALYVWEHQYFLSQFVEAVGKVSLDEVREKDLTAELAALIDRQQEMPVCLIHRDFQSQNIMIKNDRPRFIDFQGLRTGNLFYDLGSLIYDPYVPFTQAERNELVAFYYRISEPAYSLDRFTEFFWNGAAQRLMQALGAYGFLGLQKNKPDFLNHVKGGIQNLISVTSQMDNLPILNELARECQDRL